MRSESLPQKGAKKNCIREYEANKNPRDVALPLRRVTKKGRIGMMMPNPIITKNKLKNKIEISRL